MRGKAQRDGRPSLLLSSATITKYQLHLSPHSPVTIELIPHGVNWWSMPHGHCSAANLFLQYMSAADN